MGLRHATEALVAIRKTPRCKFLELWRTIRGATWDLDLDFDLEVLLAFPAFRRTPRWLLLCSPAKVHNWLGRLRRDQDQDQEQDQDRRKAAQARSPWQLAVCIHGIYTRYIWDAMGWDGMPSVEVVQRTLQHFASLTAVLGKVIACNTAISEPVFLFLFLLHWNGIHSSTSLAHKTFNGFLLCIILWSPQAN